MIEKIDFSQSEQYTLSIRLSTDGFSFSIYNPIHDDSLSIIEKEINASSSLTANLKTLFHESDFLNHPYKRVNIMMAGKRFTIAPLELFEEEQAELRQNHWRLLSGFGDFISIIAGCAVILVLITMLVSLLNWLHSDILQSISLFQTMI